MQLLKQVWIIKMGHILDSRLDELNAGLSNSIGAELTDKKSVVEHTTNLKEMEIPKTIAFHLTIQKHRKISDLKYDCSHIRRECFLNEKDKLLKPILSGLMTQLLFKMTTMLIHLHSQKMDNFLSHKSYDALTKRHDKLVEDAVAKN